MASKMNLNVKVDNSKALTALRGFQNSLKSNQKELDLFQNKIKSLGSTIDKLNSTSKNTDKNIDELGTSATKSSKAFNAMEKEIEQATASLNKLNGVSAKGGAIVQKSFGGVSGMFGSIRGEIAQTIKMMGTFGTIAGGIGLHKASTEYMDYSKSFAQFRAVVKPKDEEQVAGLKQTINSAAIGAGIDPAELARQATTLASGGVEIDVNNFAASSKEFEKIVTSMGLFAKISGSTFEESSNAIVRMGNAMGYNAEEMAQSANIDHIIGILATTLDAGLGSLSEYSTQMNKFVKTGIESGMGIEEVMSLFARQTKNMTTFMSGFSMKAITDFASTGMTEAGAAQTKIRNRLNPTGKDANGVKLEFDMGSPEMTKNVREFLAPLTESGNLMRKFFRTEDADSGEIRNATGEEVMKNLYDFGIEAREAGLNVTEMLSMVTTNENARKVAQDLNQGGWDDYLRIKKKFGDYDSMSEEDRVKAGVGEGTTLSKEEINKKVFEYTVKQSMLDREEALAASFAQHFDTASAAYTAMTITATDKMNPALSATADIFKDMFEGNTSDLGAYRDVIQKNYEDLKDSSPILAEIVKMAGGIGEYVADGTMASHIKGLGEIVSGVIAIAGGIKTAVSSLYGITEPLRDLLKWMGFDSGAVDISVGILGYGALKASLMGLGPLIGGGIATGVGASTLGGTIGAAIGPAIKTGIIGLAIGAAIGTYLKGIKDEKEAPIKKNIQGVSRTLADVKGPMDRMSESKFDSASITITEAGNKPAQFTGIGFEQKKMISAGLAHTEADEAIKKGLYNFANGIENKSYKVNKKIFDMIDDYVDQIEAGKISNNELATLLAPRNDSGRFIAEEKNEFGGTGLVNMILEGIKPMVGGQNDALDSQTAANFESFINREKERDAILGTKFNTIESNITGLSAETDNQIKGVEDEVNKMDSANAEATKASGATLNQSILDLTGVLISKDFNPTINMPSFQYLGPTGTNLN